MYSNPTWFPSLNTILDNESVKQHGYFYLTMQLWVNEVVALLIDLIRSQKIVDRKPLTLPIHLVSCWRWQISSLLLYKWTTQSSLTVLTTEKENSRSCTLGFLFFPEEVNTSRQVHLPLKERLISSV